MRAKLIYEALEDILKPRSKEEILPYLNKLSPNGLLLKSLEMGWLAGVKMALERGADIYAEPYKPLWTASANGHKDIVELLLKNGVDIHTGNDLALQGASANGHKDVVELLLKNGANVHAHDDYALQLASGNGHKDVVELLLKNGANVHARDDYALCSALEYGYEDVVELLKKYGANLSSFGIYESVEDILRPKSEEEILSHLGDLNPDDLLVKSSTTGFLPGVKLAIERGADIHGSWVDSAVRWASLFGHTDVVELLLKSGAKVSSLALENASLRGHKEIVELLKKYM